MTMDNLRRVNEYIGNAMKTRGNPRETPRDASLKVGVDLGTASIVLVVLDEGNNPVTWNMEEASVVRDGLVVDFAGASDIVGHLKEKTEFLLERELVETAIAVPPGTGARDCATHRYVAESVGLVVTAVPDEPTAANALLGVEDGAIVDIGGGTTGIAVLSRGRVEASYDEATGGTHISLVIAGNRKISFEEAERIKQNPARHGEIFPVVKPVLQKMASIISRNVRNHDVKTLYLVGGTCCLAGMDRVIAAETGIPAFTPDFPFLVTPLGIAMNCPASKSASL